MPELNDSAKNLLALRVRIANELRENPCYQSVIHELRTRRPSIPYWNPKEDNVEEIKFLSAQQKWHDVIMAILDKPETK